ncbi:hypothetical protein [Methanocaldococcus sp.]|uniref:hypothetical protein n=1 Tax=Methanocaldococcus sp. TaxID=2152917 RepID=UPI0026154C63|nr:hypothetical protein [Methanocaldococcus sp.]MCQ6253912.1 hypothetical protein [Methanocaldococcus sp.]
MIIKKNFLILLSFFILISILPVNASDSKWSSIQHNGDILIIIYNNNIYLYNGTLKNITPKYIVYLNKTYSNEEINRHFGYLYYKDSFILGNRTFIVCNAWDGCSIGKLDINDRTLYLYSFNLGEFYNLKSNNNDALGCFNNKEGMGAEPILVELKYNSTTNNLIWIGDSFYGLNLNLSKYLFKLFKYINHSKNYYFYEFEPINYCFDYNPKGKYWLIYGNGIFSVVYMKNDTSLKYVDNYLKFLVKYNNIFYDFKYFNYSLCQIVYNKYGNYWICVGENKLYLLDNDLNLIKTICVNKSIYKVFPINKDDIYLIYPKKAVMEIWRIEKVKVKNNITKETVEKYREYNKTPPLYLTEYKEVKVGEKVVNINDLPKLESNIEENKNYTYDIKTYLYGIEKINLQNNKVVEIDIDNLNSIDVGYNGRYFILIGNDSSLYIFNNGTYKKIANLNKLSENIQKSSNNKIITDKSSNNLTNYYLLGIVIAIILIFGYILWKKN